MKFRYLTQQQLADLYFLNQNLRYELCLEYQRSFSDLGKRVVLHQATNGAVKYMMDGWRTTLDYMGVSAVNISVGDNVLAPEPQILLTVAHPHFYNTVSIKEILDYREKYGLLIGQIVDRDFAADLPELLSVLPADFLLNYSVGDDPFIPYVDCPIIQMPFGFCPVYHFMLQTSRQRDLFFFAGTRSPRKNKETDAYFMPVINKYKGYGVLYGRGWGEELNPRDLGEYHAEAAINLNFHRDFQLEMINEINERVFIIPACGGFQLTDKPKALSYFFRQGEICTADDPQDYMEKFEFYAENPKQRFDFTVRGMYRVWEEHSLFHRFEMLFKKLKFF